MRRATASRTVAGSSRRFDCLNRARASPWFLGDICHRGGSGTYRTTQLTVARRRSVTGLGHNGAVSAPASGVAEEVLCQSPTRFFVDHRDYAFQATTTPLCLMGAVSAGGPARPPAALRYASASAMRDTLGGRSCVRLDWHAIVNSAARHSNAIFICPCSTFTAVPQYQRWAW